MHFLLISENEFFHEIKLDGITSLHVIHVFIDLSIIKAMIPDTIMAYKVHLNISQSIHRHDLSI